MSRELPRNDARLCILRRTQRECAEVTPVADKDGDVSSKGTAFLYTGNNPIETGVTAGTTVKGQEVRDSVQRVGREK